MYLKFFNAVLVTLPLMAASTSLCGQTINQDFVASEDSACDCGDDEPAVKVRNGATLDLNGFAISCTSPNAACISLEDDSSTVTNGFVLKCKYGIYVGEGDNQEVSKIAVELSEVGIHINSEADFTTVTENIVLDSTKNGIFVDGDDTTVDGNIIVVSGENGIEVDRGAERPKIENNKIEASTGYGILADEDNVLIRKNTLEDNIRDAINFPQDRDNVVIAENTIHAGQAEGVGIRLSGNNAEIRDNVIKGGVRGLIFAGDDAQITNNQIHGSEGSGEGGIQFNGKRGYIAHNMLDSLVGIELLGVSQVNEIDDNTITVYANAEGIALSTESSDNQLTGNTITVEQTFNDEVDGGVGILLGGSDENIIEDNSITAECASGIRMDRNSQHNDILGNTINVEACESGDKGSGISMGAFATGNTFEDNVVDGDVDRYCDNNWSKTNTVTGDVSTFCA